MLEHADQTLPDYLLGEVCNLCCMIQCQYLSLGTQDVCDSYTLVILRCFFFLFVAKSKVHLWMEAAMSWMNMQRSGSSSDRIIKTDFDKPVSVYWRGNFVPKAAAEKKYDGVEPGQNYRIASLSGRRSSPLARKECFVQTVQTVILHSRFTGNR